MDSLHSEKHFTGGNVLRDMVIGMSDGLTVPFALAAGLSGALDSTHIIVMAGLAEIAAGSIAMGLGGFLAVKGDVEHYNSELARETKEVAEMPEAEAQEVMQILQSYGLGRAESATVTQSLRNHPKNWVDFMMKYELGLEKPDPRRAITSALTIGGSYVAGGLVPLMPYVVLGSPQRAFFLSAILTLSALGLFGFIKGRFTGASRSRGALQTMAIGGIAAAAAYLIARMF